jgi:hypothetical protein
MIAVKGGEEKHTHPPKKAGKPVSNKPHLGISVE